MQYVFGYAAVSLQDVVKKSCSGGTPKKGVSEYYEAGNIPWLRTREVVFRDIYRTECFITESAVKNSAAKWIPKNCVIVAISGATAGRCAINKIPLTTNQHCLNLEVDPEMALYRYDENGNESEWVDVSREELDAFNDEIRRYKKTNKPAKEVIEKYAEEIYQSMRNDLGSNLK